MFRHPALVRNPVSCMSVNLAVQAVIDLSASLDYGLIRRGFWPEGVNIGQMSQ